MDPLEHAPHTKQQVKDALYSFLYGPVTNHFCVRLEALIDRNTMMGNYDHRHFVYKGVVYNAEITPPPLKKNRLMVQLRPAMDEYLMELAEVNNQELPYVMGFINQMLNSSRNLTDYLRVLPESVHAPIHELLATCPCRATSLPPEKVEAIVSSNANAIDMMKGRLVHNLLL